MGQTETPTPPHQTSARDTWKAYTKVCTKVAAKCFSIGSLVSIPLLFSMVIIGLVYFGSCPAKTYVPIYLIVSGLFSIVFIFLRLCGNCCKDGDGERPYYVNAVLLLLFIFLSAWFTAGSVWIYSIYSSYSKDINDENYCNNTLYLFTFWLVTVSNGLLVIILLVAGTSYLIGLILTVAVHMATTEEYA